MKKIASIGLALAIGFGSALTMVAPSSAAPTGSAPTAKIATAKVAASSVKLNQTVKNNWNAGWKNQGCGASTLKVANKKVSSVPFKFMTYSQNFASNSRAVTIYAPSQSYLNNKSEMKKLGAQTCYYHLISTAYGLKHNSLKSADKALLKKFNGKTLKNSYSVRGKGIEKAALCMGKARGIASFTKASGSCTKSEIANAKKLLKGKRA